MKTYIQPFSEVINVSAQVNNGDPYYGDDMGATGIVTSGEGLSATMAQTNENNSFEEDAMIGKRSSLWDE